MIFCKLATATGWTWDYIENEVTFPMLLAFTRFWEIWPPQFVSAARLAGWKPPEKPRELNESNKAEMARELQGISGGTVRVKI